ncbi:nicotinate-nucleotide adenylyltransferase [Gardnerella sp. DNF00536]|uniref:nicotinate-nucleotide adenylyltransferase n=1 Tax=Gardnerella sp. DNF00536 TaxID=2749050 RepID=UPI003BAEB586
MNPELHADEERRMSDLFQGSFTGKEAAPAVVARLKHRRISTRGNVHERQRIGIMGGTFDPIHNGHLVAASEVAWVYDLDEVIFVPTGRPVFKLDKKVTNAEDRYLMTVIATASNPKFTVSRVDIDRPGVTYTIDTLRDIHAQHPDAELFFITGADAVAEIMQWKHAREMWNLARFVAVTRPGYSRPEKLADSNSPLLPREPHTNDTGVVVHCDDMVHCDAQHLPVDILEIPALSISSTDVRRRAEHGEPVWYLVPDGVVQYIVKHGLYRA